MSNRGGYREGAGRKPGSLSKRTVLVEQRLQELGCDPFEGMARIAREAEAQGDLSIAGRMYAELASYQAPKRKAIDPDLKYNPNALEGWTLEQLAGLKKALVESNELF